MGVRVVSTFQSVGAAGMGMVGVAATGGWGWVRESEREFPFGITDCKDSTEGLNGGGRPDDKDGPDGEDGMGRIA